MAIRISSSTFEHNSPIPERHAAEGDDLSPPLRWEGNPPDAKQLAIIVEDPDAPGPAPWVHWLIYNIPADTRALPEGVKPTETPAEPTNTAQGKNSMGRIGYSGPEPPATDGFHRLRFRLLALDVEPTLAPGLDRSQLMDAAIGHILDQGELVGTFETVSSA